MNTFFAHTLGLFAARAARAETKLINPGVAQRAFLGIVNLPGFLTIHFVVIIYLFGYYPLFIHGVIIRASYVYRLCHV